MRLTLRVAPLLPELELRFGSFTFFVERLVDRFVTREGVVALVLGSTDELSAPAASASRASRAAITSSRDGTHSLSSKCSSRDCMLSWARRRLSGSGCICARDRFFRLRVL